MTLADRTIENAEELRIALEREHEGASDPIDKQDIYVKAHGDRCQRCGSLTFGFLPGAVQFCGDCVRRFKEADEAMWFSELLAKIRERQSS